MAMSDKFDDLTPDVRQHGCDAGYSGLPDDRLDDISPVPATPSPVTPPYVHSRTEVETTYDSEQGIAWGFMTPTARPVMTLALLEDLNHWLDEVGRDARAGSFNPAYLVFGSRSPGVFNLGGDLGLVATMIELQQREAIRGYGVRWAELLHRNWMTADLPMVTIALIQGEAIGGGFECALSFNLIVAERSATFAFPETSFGMFPGVGAHSLLSRRLNAATAQRMITAGKTWTAQELYDMGLVHILAEDGEGEAAVRAYVKQNSRNHNGHIGAFAGFREVNPLTVAEMVRIVDIWADTAMRTQPMHVKLMRRLARMQGRGLTPP